MKPKPDISAKEIYLKYGWRVTLVPAKRGFTVDLIYISIDCLCCTGCLNLSDEPIRYAGVSKHSEKTPTPILLEVLTFIDRVCWKETYI